MDEITLRKEAVRRLLAGEKVTAISRALGKSRYWVKYWEARYDPDDPAGSLQNRSRAPKAPHREWSLEVIAMALEARRRRMAAEHPGYKYALVSAQAVHYELRELGVRPTPPVRTIHYWLKQAGLVPDPEADATADKPSKPYPAPPAKAVNDVHQLDLKGPLYLSDSDQKHYLLALRDRYSKAVAVAVTLNHQAQTIADFLVAAWQRLGVPGVLQMDNGLEFRGSNRYPRSFGKVVRLCVDLGVEPWFIPPREPWRNGFIENFNGLAARLLLKKHFDDLSHFVAAAQEFEHEVNTMHRLPTLDGKTPAEVLAAAAPSLLASTYIGHQRDLKLVKGTIVFVRLVRKSGRITLCANDKFDIDPELRWQYVLARVVVAEQQLLLFHQGDLIKTLAYPM
jgi:putative transposase